MKKILVYGFKPYKEYEKNISELVVKGLKKRPGIKKVVLPIVFNKKILKIINKFKPDIIIGLGQKKRGKLLEMERTARNIYKKDRKRKISPNGPKRYFLNFKPNIKLKTVRTDYVSEDEDYLCNFTRYIIMDFIKNKKLKSKSAFIHIPSKYSLKKAIKIIERIVKG